MLRKYTQYGQLETGVARAMVAFMGDAMDPNTNPTDLPSKAKEHMDNEIIKANPKKTQYEVNQVVNIKGSAYKVTGFDEDGEPLIEAVKNK